jgi:hypothetical protein
MVGYTITGTVENAGFQWRASATPPPFPVAVGDRITWTLQYDRSLPGQSEPPYFTTTYRTTSLTITNIVDQTNGYHWFPTLSPVTSTISLTDSQWKAAKSIFAVGTYGGNSSESYNTALELDYKVSIPTSELMNLELNRLPLYLYDSYLQYNWGEDYLAAISLVTSVDSISAPVYGSPEPGSLTLFLLGAAGFAARGVRRRLMQVG